MAGPLTTASRMTASVPARAALTLAKDESRSSGLTLPRLLLRHGEASVSGARVRTSARRPERQCRLSIARRSLGWVSGSDGLYFGPTAATVSSVRLVPPLLGGALVVAIAFGKLVAQSAT